MTIKASGRAALILATGVWIGFAAPSQAATSTESAAASSKPNAASAVAVKHGQRHLQKYAHRKSEKTADKSSADKKATAAVNSDQSAAAPSSQMPPTVANANAQLPAIDTPAGNAHAMSARANTMLQATPENPANPPVVAADQLNDVDRALHDGTPAATPVALASADSAVAVASPAVAPSSDSSTWDQTSLIGKIFIGFGALLTMASAARMFMA